MNKKIIIALVAVLVITVGILGFVQYQKKKKEKAGYSPAIPNNSSSPNASATNNNSSSPNASATNNNSNDFPIKWMEYNENLKPLQKVLGVKIDGILGNETLKAIQKYYPGWTSNTQFKDKQAVDTLISIVTGKSDTVNGGVSRAESLYRAAKAGKNLIFLKAVKVDEGFIDGYGAFQKNTQRTFNKGSIVKAEDVTHYGSFSIMFLTKRLGGASHFRANAEDLTIKP